MNKMLDVRETQVIAGAAGAGRARARTRRRSNARSSSSSRAAARSAPIRPGVYQALHEAGIEPDWIIGTSIGAINASLIAGNEPENRLERLEEFWRRMRRKELWGAFDLAGAVRHDVLLVHRARRHSGFLRAQSVRHFWARITRSGRDKAGYYSTAPLEKTLTELVDFALVKRCTPRLTVGAAHVRTSQMRYFDSRETAITARHIMASGALPPAFPAVRIDGELYWDGGILSNTPTEAIFDDDPRRNSLIFAVHMWNPMGVGAGDHLGGAPPSKGHPIFKSRREPYHAAAPSAQAAPCRLGAGEIHTGGRPQPSRWSRIWPSMAAGRRCTSCGCSRLGSTMKITPRISTSARAAFVSAGKRAMPIRCARCNGRHGRMIAIRSKASFCTIQCLTSRRHPNSTSTGRPIHARVRGWREHI